MKQIVIISGKGGTGKTVLSAAFAAIANNKVMADCDVDAADLHLLLNPRIKERHIFKSGSTAFINQELCNKCGKCFELCRFSAIENNETNFIVDPVSCQGCAFCSFACPVQAIEMKENTSGVWFISDTRFGPMVHAKLGIAEENSGKLVTLIRQQAKQIAENQNADWIIIDGSPGIGCPVAASISGVDCALIITEPTLSGLHDADRVIGVTRHFKIPAKLVVNKYDLNEQMADQIERYCRDNGIDFLGKIPFDKSVVKAMVAGKTILEYTHGQVKEEIIRIWRSIQNEFNPGTLD